MERSIMEASERFSNRKKCPMTFKHSDGVWMPGRSCYVLHLALLERYDGVVQGRGRVYRERASFPSIRLNPNGLGVAGGNALCIPAFGYVGLHLFRTSWVSIKVLTPLLGNHLSSASGSPHSPQERLTSHSCSVILALAMTPSSFDTAGPQTATRLISD
ncbi:hypothetical protein L208DRAFT_711836 [Tricholoma matsutake]|nr:hypothetical protein L208DRAFT_711836 [Tricholoma matsutake 945]